MEDHSNCMNINEFPDDVLLEIFSKLPFMNQTNCSGVCRRWYSLIRSIHPKTIVIHKTVNGHLLYDIIQNQFSKQLETFELWGEENGPVLQVEAPAIAALEAKCPKLKKLVLAKCFIDHIVTIFDMPTTLQHLSLRWSEMNPETFFKESFYLLDDSDLICVNSMGLVQHLHNNLGSNRNPENISKRPKLELCLPNLICLDMCGIPLLSSQNIHALSELKNLRYLCLQQCYRINNAGMESIISILPRLTVIDIEATDVSDEGVEIILTHSTNLKELYIGYNHVTDNVLINVPTSKLLQLSTLCLKCTQVTPYCIEQLNRNVDNQVNILSSDISIEYATKNWFHITGCNHFFSHICC